MNRSVPGDPESAERVAEPCSARARRFEALGQLAGGVVHDFNNLLSVVVNYAELVLQDMDPADPRADDLREIRRAAERATNLARQLLAFGRHGAHPPRVLDLRASAGALEPMLRRLLPRNVELDVRAPPALGHVRVDPGQMEQVLVNLVVNARDAMPQGGGVTLEMAELTLGSAEADALRLSEGAYVTLAVRDTGVGMDAATRDRIFEPFFTTKEAGAGTGLGLSTVLDIVQQAGGAVRVESAPGQGSCFHVLLPRVAAGEASRSAPPTSAPLRMGTETILLVEDHAPVRAVTANILRRLGHPVLEATSAGDALLLAEQHRGGIDLLLTELDLPRLAGDQLAQRLTALRPEMGVVFMSGSGVGSADGRVEGAPLVEKPFTAQSLVRAVAEGLDRRDDTRASGARRIG